MAKIEITNKKHGCLEQGGICGKVIEYDDNDVAQIMGKEGNYNGSEPVPNTQVTLKEYLSYHNYPYKVVKKGTVIK